MDDWQPVNDWVPVGAQQPKSYSLPGMLAAIPGSAAHEVHQLWDLNPLDLAVKAATDPGTRAKLAQLIGQGVQSAKDTVGGYLQQVRDLSPPDQQGTAPRMDTAPAQAMENAVIRKVGVNVSPKRLQQALAGNLGQPNGNAWESAKTFVAEHPLAAAATVAPFAGKALGAVGDLADATGVSDALAPVAQKVGDAVAPVAQTVGNAVGNVVPGVKNFFDAGAGDAAEAVRQSALAKVLAQQQAAEEASKAAQLGMAGDENLRATMEAAAQAQAAKGVGVSDMPQAQSLVADMQARLKPTGDVVTTPTADQAKAYQSIIDTLTPTATGQKPSLEQVQNLRRQLAQTAYGGADPQGYAAIGKITRGDIVNQLHDIESAYTGGASEPVRQNYAAAMGAQEQADALAKTQNTLATQAAQLEELGPTDAVKAAKSIVNGMSKKGVISDADYRDFLQLANNVATAQGKAAFRKKLATLGGVAMMGAEAQHVGSNIIGAFK